MEQRNCSLRELNDIGCSKSQSEKYLSEADKYFKSIFENLQKEIQESNFSDSEKEIFNKELLDIFGNYFQLHIQESNK